MATFPTAKPAPTMPASPSSPAKQPQPRLYFAYGSNLSGSQMAHRCPSSKQHTPSPLAYLPGYDWVIGPRGYANVVIAAAATAAAADDEDSMSSAQGRVCGGVYGLLYELTPEDEEALDGNEGVDVGSYEKFDLDVLVLSSGGGGGDVPLDAAGEVTGRRVRALVYVDPRQGVGRPRTEYVGRMNRGLRDALAQGVPRSWIDGVVRKFIPEEGVEV